MERWASHIVCYTSISQPHYKPLWVVSQKVIIIKDVKTAPAPSLPRTGTILISRSPPYSQPFFVRFGHFFSRERFPCESFKEMAYWVSYRSRLISGRRSARPSLGTRSAHRYAASRPHTSRPFTCHRGVVCVTSEPIHRNHFPGSVYIVLDKEQ